MTSKFDVSLVLLSDFCLLVKPHTYKLREGKGEERKRKKKRRKKIKKRKEEEKGEQKKKN